MIFMFSNVFFERKWNYVFKSFKKGKRHTNRNHCKNASEANLHQRTGDNGIRYSCRCTCRYCNTRNSCLQAKTSRALGRDIKRNEAALNQFISSFEYWSVLKFVDSKGQSSVEFAVVAIVLVVVVVGVGAILSRLTDGTFLLHAIMAATNNITTSVSGAIDAFSF